MRLLIAEDDLALAGFLARGLRGEGDEVVLAHDGDAALAAFLRKTPDLLVLDIEMPRRSGMEVLSAIRAVAPFAPVLVLSGRAETETRSVCLEMGADDCMMKPFALRELRARCGALLRRATAMRASHIAHGSDESRDGIDAHVDPHTIVLGCLQIRRMQRQAQIAGAPVHLTNIEFALLEQLALAGSAPVSRSTLRSLVWPGRQIETNALDVHISALRRKLGAWPGAPAIETVRGKGFFLTASRIETTGGDTLRNGQLAAGYGNGL